MEIIFKLEFSKLVVNKRNGCIKNTKFQLNISKIMPGRPKTWTCFVITTIVIIWSYVKYDH